MTCTDATCQDVHCPLCACVSRLEIYEDDKRVSVLESQQTILNPEVAASHYTLLLIDMSGSVVDSEDAGKVTEAALLFTSEVEANNMTATGFVYGGAYLPKRICRAVLAIDNG